MNKPSKVKPKTSPFSRIMAKGQARAGYKPTSGDLLMQLSENDHKRIATLIAKWLETDNSRNPK